MKHNYIIKEAEFTLRSINEDDLYQMRVWRNSEWSRVSFFNTGIISEADQKQWYEAYSNRLNDYMFIIEVDNREVGTVAIYNVDLDNKKAEFGRLLLADDSVRGKGYAKKITEALSKFAFSEFGLQEIILEVFYDNRVALSLYEKVGYTTIDSFDKDGRKVLRMVLRESSRNG